MDENQNQNFQENQSPPQTETPPDYFASKQPPIQSETIKIRKSTLFSTVILVFALVFSGIAGGIYLISRNNLSPTSSSSSNSSSSNSSSSNSSSQASNSNSSESPISSSAASVKLNSYTNPFFPNLKVTYDESWKFETTTKEANYKGLLNRTFVFSKDGKSFKINLTSKILTGCSGSGEDDIKESVNLGNGVYKIKYSFPGETKVRVEYSKSKTDVACILTNPLETNIKTSEIPTYKTDFPTDATVIYFFSVDTSSINIDDLIYSQVDKIIGQSVLN